MEWGREACILPRAGACTTLLVHLLKVVAWALWYGAPHLAPSWSDRSTQCRCVLLPGTARALREASFGAKHGAFGVFPLGDWRRSVANGGDDGERDTAMMLRRGRPSGGSVVKPSKKFFFLKSFFFTR